MVWSSRRRWIPFWPRSQPPPSAPPPVVLIPPSVSYANRIMWDSTTPLAIPLNAQLVAGYVDGRYAWPQSAWARWPTQRRVTIAVDIGTTQADVLDVEAGAADPAQARVWVQNRLRLGVRAPICYCNRSTEPALRAALTGLNWRWWAADWTGQLHTIPGAVAVQYASPGIGTPTHVDLSVVTDPSFPN